MDRLYVHMYMYVVVVVHVHLVLCICQITVYLHVHVPAESSYYITCSTCPLAVILLYYDSYRRYPTRSGRAARLTTILCSNPWRTFKTCSEGLLMDSRLATTCPTLPSTDKRRVSEESGVFNVTLKHGGVCMRVAIEKEKNTMTNCQVKWKWLLDSTNNKQQQNKLQNKQEPPKINIAFLLQFLTEMHN